MRTIEFYRTSAGNCPVEEYLDSISDQDARKIAWVLRLVRNLQFVPSQYFKRLADTDNLWEIRVQLGSKNHRFLCFFDGATLLILTSGFLKKQQKTPLQEITVAQQRRTDYLQRKNNG